MFTSTQGFAGDALDEVQAKGAHTLKTNGASIRREVPVPLRLADGFEVDSVVFSFSDLSDGLQHLAVGLGDFRNNPVPLVRPHSECLTGDVFGSARCDCGPQLLEAIHRIAAVGGYLLYLRQEGRGIGLYNKLDAYALQDAGLDTYEANLELHLPADGRDYRAVAEMLEVLGARKIDLLSNNPDKALQLEGYGVDVRSRVSTGVFLSDHNRNYLRAKVLRSGHFMALDDSM